MYSDYMIKAIDNQHQIRVMLATTTRLVNEARRRHNTSATASAALGRVLTAAVMMGTELKDEKAILTIRINGNGLSGPIVATADAQGHVRGLISNPQADLPSRYPGKLAVGEMVGKEGYIEVIKDLGLKQPFIGRVPLVSGEIAEDIAKYYLDSEQIPALVASGVLVAPDLSIRASGGLIVQAMPGADDTLLEKVENNIIRLMPISNVLNQNSNLEDILAEIMEGIAYSAIGRMELAFECNCNQDRIGAIIAGFDEKEIKEIIKQYGKIEAVCNFCNEVYHFSLDDIKRIKSKKP